MSHDHILFFSRTNLSTNCSRTDYPFLKVSFLYSRLLKDMGSELEIMETFLDYVLSCLGGFARVWSASYCASRSRSCSCIAHDFGCVATVPADRARH